MHEERIFYADSPVEREKIEFCVDYRSLIEQRLENYGDIPVFKYQDYKTGIVTEIMPGQFKQECEALGSLILSEGYRRAHIGIMGANSYNWILAMHAIVCSDNVVVLLDKNLEEDRLAEQIRDGDVQCIFYSDDVAQKAHNLSIYCPGEPISLNGIQQMVEAGRSLMEKGDSLYFDMVMDSMAPAVIMFTSGTTGKSKGVMLSQRNLIVNTVCGMRLIDSAYDSILFLPLNHIFGVGTTVLNAILTGKTLVINTVMRRMMKDFEKFSPGILFIVPMMIENFYHLLWNSIKQKGREAEVNTLIANNRKKGNVSSSEKRQIFAKELEIFGGNLHKIISGGAPLPMNLKEGFEDFGIDIYEGYGITECSPILSINCENLNKAGSAGRILEGSQLMIAEPDERGCGEICVKGPSVMLGYYKNEEQTAEAMEGGWFHTGDLGYMDEDKYIYITGRSKNLIILANGENVSPEELELRLLENPVIKEAVVYEKNNRIGVQIYSDDEAAKEEYLQSYVDELNKALPVFKRIHYVELREKPFERTTSGKIKRTPGV